METNDESNNANEHNVVENPTDRMQTSSAVYKRGRRSSGTRVYRETTPA